MEATDPRVRSLGLTTLRRLGIAVPPITHAELKRLEKLELHADPKLSFGVPLTVLTERTGVKRGQLLIPRILLDLADKLKGNLGTEGLFRVSGSASRMKAIESAVNTGGSVDGTVHDLAGTLKAFFRELPEPLLTHRLYMAFVKAWRLQVPEQRKQAVLLLCQELPPIHLHTTIFLMALLADVVKSSSNRMSAANLSAVFTPNILRPDDADRKTQTRAATTTELELQNHSACVGVVELLILHHAEVGVVPPDVLKAASVLDIEKAKRDVTVALTPAKSWWPFGRSGQTAKLKHVASDRALDLVHRRSGHGSDTKENEVPAGGHKATRRSKDSDGMAETSSSSSPVTKQVTKRIKPDPAGEAPPRETARKPLPMVAAAEEEEEEAGDHALATAPEDVPGFDSFMMY